jgi:hypothetical protein
MVRPSSTDDERSERIHLDTRHRPQFTPVAHEVSGLRNVGQVVDLRVALEPERHALEFLHLHRESPCAVELNRDVRAATGLLDVELVLRSLDVELVVDVLPLSEPGDLHQENGYTNMRSLANGGPAPGGTKPTWPGRLASSEFPSPLRRRYAAGPAFRSLIGARLRVHERLRA